VERNLSPLQNKVLMANPLTIGIGRVLRQKREAAGFTQECLADRAAIDRSYVSILERGLKSPTVEMLDRLANSLGCLPEDIISESRK
jgi:transcriptional regulator with XRE-family HTH domain